MTRMPRRILVVSYFHPPFPGAGGSRWATMSDYLTELGYCVRILTTDAFGTLPTDRECGVTRVRDLRSIGVLRRLLRRGELPIAAHPSNLEKPPTPLLTKVVVPDVHAVSWVPAAARALRRIAAEEKIDCLVTSSPPDSVHLLGLLLGRARPAWVADFRDGWNFEPGREAFPTAAQRCVDAWLERRVARTCSVAVGATMPIAADLGSRLTANAAFVPNGWDPRLEPKTQVGGRRDGSVFNLVFTGTLGARDPHLVAFRSLLCALGRANRDGRWVRLLLAGRLTTSQRMVIQELDATGLVEYVGAVGREEAISLQRTSDALVLLTSKSAGEATSKLYEYLFSGRPILALAENNEAARIVRETRTGIAVPPDDVDAVVNALAAVKAGELTASYAPRGIDQFKYPAPAKAMSDALEQAIGTAGARG